MATASTPPTTESPASPGAVKPQNLQKMLDMEHKLKMERMQVSASFEPPPPPRPSYGHSPAASSSSSFQARVKDVADASDPVSMPASSSSSIPRRYDSPHSGLTVAIPRRSFPLVESQKGTPKDSSRASPEAPPKTPPMEPPHPVVKSVSFLPGEKDDGDDSDNASSICQSPSWENYGHSKKKEMKAEEKQRKKLLEQAEREAREYAREQARKPQAKLTKAPPPIKAPPPSASRTPALGTRVASGPTPPSPSARSRPSSAQFENAAPSQAPPKRQRRSSSVASQIRAALTGSKSREAESQEHEFIGGLKLEQEREAETIAAMTEATRGTQPLAKSKGKSRNTEPIRPRAIPQKAHTFGAETESSKAATPLLSRSMTDEPSPSSILPMRSKEGPPVSMRPSTRGNDSVQSPAVAPKPDSTAMKRWKEQTGRASSSDERLESADSGRDEPVRGRRGSISYVNQQRQQSQDRAISGYKDEMRASARSRYPPKANKEYHNRAAASAPDISQRPGTAGSASGNTGQPVIAELEAPTTSTTSLPRQRSSSRERLSHAARGIKNAMHAAKHKVRPSSRPSSITAASAEDLGRGSDATSSKKTPYQHLEVPQNGRGRSSQGLGGTDSHGNPTAHGRPSSSSSSHVSDAWQSPSTVATPDSSRPQSDKGLPPVLGEVGNGVAGQLLVTNDERVHQTPQSAHMSADVTPMSPRSDFSFVPSHNGGGDDNNVTVHKLSPGEWDRSMKDVEADAASFKTCLDAAETSSISSGEKTASEPTGAGKNKQRPGRGVDRVDEGGGNTDSAAQIAREPSLSKSRSTPYFTPKTRHQQAEHEQHPMPPPRSSARNSNSFEPSSMSLPDALNSHQKQQQQKQGVEPRRNIPTSSSSSTMTPRAPQPSRFSAGSGRKEGGVDPVAKMFVECCSCKFLHDMPSRVYECMAKPDATVEDPKLGVSGAITTVVKCPWCKHGMTTQCCAGYAAVVYLKERLH